MTYSFIDKNMNKIVAYSLTQISEAGNSNRMEKMGFEKSLRLLKNEGIILEQITTDRRIKKVFERGILRSQISSISLMCGISLTALRNCLLPVKIFL